MVLWIADVSLPSCILPKEGTFHQFGEPIAAIMESDGQTAGDGGTMDIKKMRAFITLADVGTYTRASEILYMAQSSLSAQVKSLEQELGAPLLTRTNKGVELTQAGDTFLKFCNQTVAEYELMLDRVRRQSACPNTEIGIFYNKRLRAWCHELARANEDPETAAQYSLSIRLLYGREKEQMLLNGELPVGLCPRSSRLDEAGLSFQPLYRDVHCLCVPHGHPLYAAETLALADFANEPVALISPTKTEVGNEVVARLVGDFGFSRRNLVYKQSLDEIDLAMRTERLAGFMTMDLARTEFRCYPLPEKVAPALEYGWYYRTLTPGVQWVLDNLR